MSYPDPLHQLELELLKEEHKEGLADMAGRAMKALADASREISQLKAERAAAEAQVERLLRERGLGEWSRP